MILKPVVIDNWYNKQELKKVYKELDFYNEKDKLVSQHGNVAVEDGRDKADCYRVPLSTYYSPEGTKLSDILTLMHKVRDKKFHDYITKVCGIYHGFQHTGKSSSLLAYYEDTQYYESHTDTSKYSIMIWINKEPKKFFKIAVDKNLELKSDRRIYAKKKLLRLPNSYHSKGKCYKVQLSYNEIK